MILWRIYYDGGATFDSSMGDPEDAPPYGVLAIVYQCKERGRQVVRGWDWYHYRTDAQEWYGCDREGLFDHLLNRPRVTHAVKQGRTVSNSDWRLLCERVSSDSDFPPASPGKQHAVRTSPTGSPRN